MPLGKIPSLFDKQSTKMKQSPLLQMSKSDTEHLNPHICNLV